MKVQVTSPTHFQPPHFHYSQSQTHTLPLKIFHSTAWEFLLVKGLRQPIMVALTLYNMTCLRQPPVYSERAKVLVPWVITVQGFRHISPLIAYFRSNINYAKYASYTIAN